MSVHPISEELTKVTVIGAGAWGTALAIHCARKGHDTMLWAMEPHAVEEINTKHTNETFLKVRPERRSDLLWVGRMVCCAEVRCVCLANMWTLQTSIAFTNPLTHFSPLIIHTHHIPHFAERAPA